MRFVLSGALILMCGLFLFVSGGRIEGLIFPVVTPGDITRIEAVGETYSRIWGQSTRLRDCSFSGLEWRYGDRSHYSIANLTFEEGTRVRGRGAFEFGPWLVQLSPEQLTGQSYAVVLHRCHWFWLTETLFYQPE